MRFDPWLRNCVKRANLACGVTAESAAELQRLGSHAPEVMPAISLPDEEARALGERLRTAGHTTRFLFIGRLLAWKGIHLALRALAACKQKNSTYRIIGDGPARKHLTALAASLGLGERVQFTGNLARTEALDSLQEADALVFPSLHDSGGYAVIEAMAAGLPIICLDLGGPGLFVTDDCGWKIRPRSPQQTIQDLADALDDCAASPTERLRRGTAARSRCLEHFTASAHGKRLDAMYQSLQAGPT